MYTTSVSLLERLKRPEEQSAWDRFIAIYTPLLYHWALKLQLSPEDSADLVQDVFATLVVKLPNLTYDQTRSFRGWLLTVTRNKLFERRRLRRVVEVRADSHCEPPLDDDPGEIVAKSEYAELVTQRCLEVMRSSFLPSTWQAFWKLVVEGMTAPEVAAEMGLSISAVYSAKVRVMQRLREELAGLVDDIEPPRLTRRSVDSDDQLKSGDKI